MKKLTFFSVLIYLLMTLSVSAKSKPLYFLGDDDFPPFSFEEKGKIVGIDVDIVKEAAKRLNLKVKIKLNSWKGLLRATEMGKCDGSFSLFKTAEREKYAMYTAPVHYSTYMLFVKKEDGFKFSSVSDLYGKTVGLNKGFSISDDFDKAVKNKKIKVQYVNGDVINIKRLMAGKSDVLVGNLHTIQYTLKQLGLVGKIKFLKTPITQKRGAFLVLSKKSKQKDKKHLQAKFQETIEEMYKDGTVQRIEQKYFN